MSAGCTDGGQILWYIEGMKRISLALLLLLPDGRSG